MKRSTSVNASSVNIRPGGQKNLQAIGLTDANNAFNANLGDSRTSEHRCIVKRCPSVVGSSVNIRPDF